MTEEQRPFRRVLIVADETAEWLIAGLRQLDRVALAVDEFAIENNEKAPVHVCIFWRPTLDQSQRWVPDHERLTRVAFATELDGEPYDVLLNTRLFIYRNGLRQFLEESSIQPENISREGEGEQVFWEKNYRQVAERPHFSAGAWEYVTDGEQIDGIERRFLRSSGKTQDGFVSRYLNRPISRAVTRLLLRFPTTPNAWTWGIFAIPIIATLVLLQGTYWSFFWGLLFYHVFSVLDGCDGEIARAKFLESERGRWLDDLFDVLSNILLVIGLGSGLFRQAVLAGHPGWLYLIEGIASAVLIIVNEFYLPAPKAESHPEAGPLKGSLYPRHRQLVQNSGILVLGERFASWLIQITKRDVAVLFFVFLAAIGRPALILHLLFSVAAASLVLWWRAHLAVGDLASDK